MKNKSYFGLGPLSSLARVAGLGLLLALLTAPAAASAPDWLRAAAGSALGKYPDDVSAVLLLDERITTVKDNGEITTLHRRAYKILHPEGRDYGLVAVHFDSETKLSSLHAWCIPANGQEYEVKEKDAVETSLLNESFYEDTRHKVLRIPAADPGNVVGYEYEQRQRPYVLQSLWEFQPGLPVLLSRFTLHLPKGWEYKAFWRNHAEVAPQPAGDGWTWEVRDVSAVEPETSMPAEDAVAGRMAIFYYPARTDLSGKSLVSWSALGTWFTQLSAGRRDPSPAIQQKVQELTAGQQAPLDKMRAIASFLQRDVRYVAIEVGIGGYQPHAAGDVFSNRYGDCKDKATLMSAMLQQIGVQSYYILVNTSRGVVAGDEPLALTFNHVILAIQVPPGAPTETLYALYQHPKLGKLLIFDPTDHLTPFGSLPSNEEGNRGLLVTPDGGELIDLPLLAPNLNRLLRTAQFTLAPDGRLTGQVQEVLSGPMAADYRAALLRVPIADRRKVVERYLGNFLSGFSMQDPTVENLEKYDQNLVIRYQFASERYAKMAGNLLLVRPRVLGQKSADYFRGKDRHYPVEFDAPTLQSDVFEITLPPGFSVDDLPNPVDLDAGFASYKSQVEVKDNVLRYSRQYEIKDILVPTEKLPELKKFYRQVAGDENASAVLKHAN